MNRVESEDARRRVRLIKCVQRSQSDMDGEVFAGVALD